MGARLHRLAGGLTLALLLAACRPDSAAEAVTEAGEAATPSIDAAQVEVAQAVSPLLRAVQDAGAVLSEALPPPGPRERLDPRAVDLIVGFEITSPAYYRARLQGVICPGGASGPTWGIGYDGGHQSAARIRADWAMHPDVERLASTAGAIGPVKCAAARAQLRDVRVPLAMAQDVFDRTMMPTWLRVTRRAYPGVQDMTAPAEGGLVSNTFNRGPSFLGPRAVEKRHVRDVCVPARDAPCAAHQVRTSCRVWRGTDLEAGLCRRRNAEGDLIEASP